MIPQEVLSFGVHQTALAWVRKTERRRPCSISCSECVVTHEARKLSDHRGHPLGDFCNWRRMEAVRSNSYGRVLSPFCSPFLGREWLVHLWRHGGYHHKGFTNNPHEAQLLLVQTGSAKVLWTVLWIQLQYLLLMWGLLCSLILCSHADPVAQQLLTEKPAKAVDYRHTKWTAAS